MSRIKIIEATILETLFNVIKRTSEIKGKDQLSLAKEFKEWLEGPPFDEEILVIDESTFKNYDF